MAALWSQKVLYNIGKGGQNPMALDYSEIGKRIAQRRKALGLKQAAVCE